MANGEGKQNTVPETESDLAKDVAHLYSWANLEGVPYRDFSRQRKIRHVQHAMDADIRSSEAVPAAEVSIESEAQGFEASIAPPAGDRAAAVSAEPAAVVEIPAETAQAQETTLPEIPVAPVFFEPVAAAPAEGISSALAIYSLAGGVGKTTFCANLGRIFAAMKEKVLLADVSGSGLLPFYFGATDLKCGLRTFVAPDANYPPLQVIGTDEITKEWLEHDVQQAMQKADRTIFDLGPASMSLVPDIVSMCGTVLVPLLPDLNSILTISRIEASFNAMRSSGRAVPEVFYIFNRFDEQDSIDMRAHALVHKQCAERLLSLTIRDAGEIAKAIASRMTVADHAPGSAVTHDFLELATWVRKRAPVRAAVRTQVRWSEQ